ncbi:MAG: hypothetical protein L6M37_05700 [Candidatus Methylarchaceae archaeon HK02M1]|nr:hypothetical protein [Candidatus Methylarchaceae archaeon HK02M1]
MAIDTNIVKALRKILILYNSNIVKFAFTKIADVLGSLATHAIAGHKKYFITYYKKSRKERAKDYLKAIPRLNLFTPSEEEKGSLIRRGRSYRFTLYSH